MRKLLFIVLIMSATYAYSQKFKNLADIKTPDVFLQKLKSVDREDLYNLIDSTLKVKRHELEYNDVEKIKANSLKGDFVTMKNEDIKDIKGQLFKIEKNGRKIYFYVEKKIFITEK